MARNKTPARKPAKTRKAASKDSGAALLLEKLVAIIQSQRQLGGTAYPLRLRRLAELADATGADAVKVVTLGEKAKRLVSSRSLTRNAASTNAAYVLIALAEDVAVLAASEALLVSQLEAALKRGPSADHKGVATGLSKAVSVSFTRALERRLEARTLPPGFGAVQQPKGGHLFFRLEALIGVPLPSPSNETQAEVRQEFAQRFSEMFLRLDGAATVRNYVPLQDLRQALPEFSRTEFDRGLAALRLDRKFTLDASDGRQARVTPEQLAAGIPENGSVLVYVARREQA